MRIFHSVAFAGALSFAVALPVAAQRAGLDRSGISRPFGSTAGAERTGATRGPLAATAPGADSMPCWDCARARQPWVAFGEWQIGMWGPWLFNKYAREGNISDVGGGFWWDNIWGPWDWDTNGFIVNQIGHPAQGSTYYNGYRTNGYGFWTSSAMAGAGSFVWECCGERNLPSINDLITTWMGGTTLGEVTRRLSDMVIDNQATGSERFWREAAAGVVNPVRLVDRVARGHAWKIGANEPGTKPDWMQGVFSVGGVVLGSERLEDRETLTGGKIMTRLMYGSFDETVGKPFSHFEFEAELTTIEHAYLYLIRSRGSLFGNYLGARADSSRLLTGFIRYDYVHSRAFELGEQSFTVDFARRWRSDARTRVVAEIGARVVPMAAIQVDFVTPSDEGRDYDYGYGGGMTLKLSMIRKGVGSIVASTSHTALRVADGVASSHEVGRYELGGYAELGTRHGLGLGLRHQVRRSFYTDLPRTSARAPEAWLSYITALPRWNP